MPKTPPRQIENGFPKASSFNKGDCKGLGGSTVHGGKWGNGHAAKILLCGGGQVDEGKKEGKKPIDGLIEVLRRHLCKGLLKKAKLIWKQITTKEALGQRSETFYPGL